MHVVLLLWASKSNCYPKKRAVWNTLECENMSFSTYSNRILEDGCGTWKDNQRFVLVIQNCTIHPFIVIHPVILIACWNVSNCEIWIESLDTWTIFFIVGIDNWCFFFCRFLLAYWWVYQMVHLLSPLHL